MVKAVKLEKLKFYDVKGKTKFTSDKYKFVSYQGNRNV